MTDNEQIYVMMFKEWSIEIRKFMRINKIKVKEGKRNTKNASRIAHFVSESYLNTCKKLKGRGKIVHNVMGFINSIEPQIFTFAKKYSLECNELPSEKPIGSSYRQPNRKLIAWGDAGFVIAELESKVEELLKEVFKI